ncbi:hypothetical protein MKZ38_006398 [Zalerion maritima]|uniref:Uncharacterized protein n=1 Tax=Zalerion maritima TaxID=339359 RepID=A0AAD5RIV9_9PEZI|nr:hypothetical protein MKZ38_006398 [Zalerion maritima]
MPRLSAAQEEREKYRKRASSTSHPSQSSQPQPSQQHQQGESSLPSSQETDRTDNTDTTGTRTSNETGNSSDGSKAEVYLLDAAGREDSDEGVHDISAHIKAASVISAPTQTQQEGVKGNPPYPTDSSETVRPPPQSDSKGKGKAPAHGSPSSAPYPSSPGHGESGGSNNAKKSPKSGRRLFVFHGLRPELLSQLPSMGVDPEFITAHLLRRPYRPRLVQLNGQQRHGPRGERVVKWSFAHFQYPELVCRGGEDWSSGEEGYLGTKRTARKNGSDGTKQDENIGPPDRDLRGGKHSHASHAGHGGNSSDEETIFIDGRIAGDPPVLSMPGGEDAVVMCRASLWMSEKGDAVLILDRPVWRDPQVHLRKTYWHDSLSNSIRASLEDETSSLRSCLTTDATLGAVAEHGAPSLHDAMQEWLNNYPADFDYRAVLSSVVELAYDRWLEFFDALDLRPMPSSRERGMRGAHGQEEVNDLLGLYWRSQMALETNADGFSYMTARGMVMPRGRADWGVLLSRIKRRVELLNLAATIVQPRVPPPPLGAGLGTTKTPGTMTAGVDAGSSPSFEGSKGKRHHHHHRRMSVPLGALTTTTTPMIGDGGEDCTPQEKERERGLDRVAYMGGIFLPFTIVSSVLSMTEPFSPGQNMHWVFWVFAAPLAMGAVVFIYADSIRRAEVWIEVSDWREDHDKAKQSEKQEQDQDIEDEKVNSNEQGLPPPVPGPPPKFNTRRSWRRRSRAAEATKLSPIQSLPESAVQSKTKMEDESGGPEAPGRRPHLQRESALTNLNALAPGGKLDMCWQGQSMGTSCTSSISDEPILEEDEETDSGRRRRPESRAHGLDDDDQRLVQQTPMGVPGRRDTESSRVETGTSRNVSRRPTSIFRTAGGGENTRTWKRQRLGWGGAWKTMVGYYVPNKGEDVPLGVKAYEVRGGARTKMAKRSSWK